MDYILWGTCWVNLQMMLVDAPRYEAASEVKEIESVNDAKEFLRL